jgi:hypothetical protein
VSIIARNLLLRIARTTGPIGAVLTAAHRRCVGSLAAFEAAVAPILTAAIRDPDELRYVASALRAWAVKGSHIMGSYADMADIPFPAETCAVGAAFARIYDDLLDDTHRVDFAARVGALFAQADFTPTDDMECALHALFRDLERRLGRDNHDPIYSAARELHRYQTMSCGQRTGTLSPTEVDAVTLGKGGLSLVVLFALVRPAMSRPERALIEQLGGTLQLLDDYQDRVVDRRRATHTPATDGRLRLIDIHRRLRGASPELYRFYGPRARRFLRELYLFQLVALLGLVRSWLFAPRPVPATARDQAPLRVLLQRGGSVVRPGGDRVAC